MLSKISVQNKNKRPKIILVFVLVFILILLVFSVTFARMIKSPASKTKTEKQFEVAKGEGVRDIAQSLYREKLLNHPTIFLIYLKKNGLNASLKAGKYTLDTGMNIIDIANVLTEGKIKSSKVTILEGWRLEETGAYLEKQGVGKKSEYMENSKKQYDFSFLKDKPSGQGLEGYLFPDTYFLSPETDQADLVLKMLENFDKKFTQDLKAEAVKQGFSIHEVITLASIVEKEVGKKEDKELVSGVLKNRLKLGMPLQSDVTNHYIVGDWKKELTADDLALPSPYNTRVNKGLPPGPICSPGLDSIRAALFHKESDYLYYLSAKDGTTYFSYNQEEHDEKKAKYLR